MSGGVNSFSVMSWDCTPSNRFVHKFKGSLEYLGRLPVANAQSYLQSIGYDHTFPLLNRSHQ